MNESARWLTARFFNTITNGKNTMLAYGPNVSVTGPLGNHRVSARVAAEPECD